jgi:hypothetical protein
LSKFIKKIENLLEVADSFLPKNSFLTGMEFLAKKISPASGDSDS